MRSLCAEQDELAQKNRKKEKKNRILLQQQCHVLQQKKIKK